MNRLELCRKIDDIMMNEVFSFDFQKVNNLSNLKISFGGEEIEITKLGENTCCIINGVDTGLLKVDIINALHPYLNARFLREFY